MKYLTQNNVKTIDLYLLSMYNKIVLINHLITILYIKKKMFKQFTKQSKDCMTVFKITFLLKIIYSILFFIKLNTFFYLYLYLFNFIVPTWI